MIRALLLEVSAMQFSGAAHLRQFVLSQFRNLALTPYVFAIV